MYKPNHLSYVTDATFEDSLYLSENMRPEDLEECWGEDPLTSLETGRYTSDFAKTFRNQHGDIVGMFGVAPLPSHPDIGCPWLLCTPKFDDISFEFARESRYWVRKMEEFDYAVLTNVTDSENPLHHRWLVFCGFTPWKILENFGPTKRTAIQFCRIVN